MEVSKDGRTSYERSKGKKSKEIEYEFAEGVWWRRKVVKTTLKKLEIMWQDGIYLGKKATTGETIIGTAEGIFRTRTVRKKPAEDRWDQKHMDMIGGTPWRTQPEVEDADGERLPTELRPEKAERLATEEEKEDMTKEMAPKGFTISKADLDNHGYSKGCLGCAAVLRGNRAQMHKAACRRRLEIAMRDQDKVKVAKKKMDEYLAKVIEKDADERGKKEEENNGNAEESGKEAGGNGYGSSDKREVEREDGDDRRAAKKAKVVEEIRERKRGEAEDEADDEESRNAKRARGNVDMLDIMEVYPSPHEHEEYDKESEENGEWAIDDLTGKSLDVEEVKAARKEEMTFVKGIPVYKEVEVKECWERTGKGPVTTKWVDVEKRDMEKLMVRSRWVARDFKGRGEEDREDLFAATPPLEAKKLLFKWVRRSRADGKRNLEKVMLIDVRKAHLNAVCEDEVYVELPIEAEAGVKCGKLLRWLYGMRPAANAWEKEYVGKLSTIGFERGKYSPVVFYNSVTGVRCVVHGDDFTFTGKKDELMKVMACMMGWWDIKLRGILGGESGDDKEATILGRHLRWTEAGIEYEADPKHAQLVIEEMGLSGESRAVDSPIEKEVVSEEGEAKLDKIEAKKFRGVAARLNYLAADRPDIQYAVKEICRGMASPSVKHLKMLKRIARYLINKPTLVMTFGEVDEAAFGVIEGFSDTDWAGCRITRKSTSGGMLVIGGSVLKSWAKTQSVIATSSGEAEYYGLAKTSAEAIGLRSLCHDLGIKVQSIVVWVDSSAAKAVAGRVGAGKLRHVEVTYLWIQSQVQSKRLKVRKVKGEDNPADILTKPKYIKEMRIHLEKLGMEINTKPS